MNDALEFKPPITGVASRPRLEQVIQERFRALHPGQLERIEAMLPREQAEQLIKESISKTADLAEQNLQESIATIYDVSDKNFGILSLSEDPTNLLMGRTMLKAVAVFSLSSTRLIPGSGRRRKNGTIFVIFGA